MTEYITENLEQYVTGYEDGYAKAIDDYDYNATRYEEASSYDSPYRRGFIYGYNDAIMNIDKEEGL